MKKIFLLSLCLLFGSVAKAADFEISTTLSYPYGMFSTLTVFGDVSVDGDLFIGANSMNSATVATPMQDVAVSSGQSIKLPGPLQIENDLSVFSDTQKYTSLNVRTGDSGGGALFPTYADVKGINIAVNSLNAANVYTGPVKFTDGITVGSLFAGNLTIGSFSFPKIRQGSSGTYTGNGTNVNSATPGNCGPSTLGHYYGPWRVNTANESDNCNSDINSAYTCPNNSSNNKNCKDVRQATYTSPSAFIRQEPILVETVPVYNKCVSGVNAEGKFQCDFNNTEDVAKEAEYQSIGVVLCSVTDVFNEGCSSLCQNAHGSAGCEAAPAYCYVKRIDPNGATNCRLSGWEIGSGLECTDAYQKIRYELYACPINSDYYDNPDTGLGATLSFSIVRDVACVKSDEVNPDATNTYCNNKYLVLEF